MGQRELAKLEVFNDQGHDVPYIPQCDAFGLFEPLQRSDNGSSWCVNSLNGKVIENTFQSNSIAACSIFGKVASLFLFTLFDFFHKNNFNY